MLEHFAWGENLRILACFPLCVLENLRQGRSSWDLRRLCPLEAHKEQFVLLGDALGEQEMRSRTPLHPRLFLRRDISCPAPLYPGRNISGRGSCSNTFVSVALLPLLASHPLLLQGWAALGMRGMRGNPIAFTTCIAMGSTLAN